ncbi:ubiquitin-associated domain-containing protein 1 [Anabrus simplex]|uniref:ubiquitin-associated domain-containing protein 1 n=1 Tax=Anabrus simplex TaxID=316456 RepID=UPI0035A3A2CB
MLPWMREKLFGGRQKLINILNRRCESETKTNSRSLADMFVSDSNIFSSENVKLSVISSEGGVWNVDAAPDFTVDKLKTMALCHFYNPVESAKVSANYRLVLVSERRSLVNDNSVFQEGLKSNDELLLVERRKPPPREPFTEESLRGPSEDEIKAATCNLESKNTVKIHPPLECSADFQSEIRKILISLVEASARILTATPNAEEVFEHIRERLESKSKPQPDPQAVKELIDMGFPEHVAAKALLLNSSNQRQALDWLLEHGNEIDAVPDDEEMSLNGESSGGQAGSSKSSEQDYQKGSKKSTPTMTQTVAKLLDSFRAYKRQEFKPNPKALENLMEMGFAEEEIIDALRITGNNQASACEWLLGERRPSLEDLDNGLDPEGPIYKAIMANPAIQLSLTSPKMLFAFLSMLENPGSANMWINDPDASPVLSQIFKTYHAEKHAQQINRLMEQQQQHRRL